MAKEKKHIIGMCGYALSGKDTAALNLIELGFKRFAFADALKRDIKVMVDYACTASGIPKPDLDNPGEKSRVRNLYVAHGAYMRSLCPDIWVNRLITEIGDYPGNVVITDVRYANEVAAIEARGGVVVRIMRGNFPANPEESKSFEQIETKYPGMIIMPNYGTIEQLDVRMKTLAQWIVQV